MTDRTALTAAQPAHDGGLFIAQAAE